jgi:DNA-binding XRE family transcriptional regulator
LGSRANDLEVALRELYTEYHGEIPSEEQVYADYEELYRDWHKADPYYDGFPNVEELQFELDRASKTKRYYVLIDQASEEARLAAHWQEKLEHFLDIQARMEVNMRRLKELRQLRALSQEELAEESGVGRATISRIERGETGAHGRTLRRLAKALGVGVEELVKVEANDG